MNDTEITSAWLLESETPSIRYLTFTTILGKGKENVETAAARRSIPEQAPAKTILDEQQTAGYWASDRHYYGPKYRSSHWSMLLLTEIAVPPEHPKMRKGAQYMLERAYRNKDDWIFQENVGCFWGNSLNFPIQ